MKLPEKSGKWIFRKYSEWDAFALHEFRSFLLRYSNDRQLQGKKKDPHKRKLRENIQNQKQ